MTETDYKQKLKQDIEYTRNHTPEEIREEFGKMPLTEATGMYYLTLKKITFDMDEYEIDEYIEKRWELIQKEKELHKKANEEGVLLVGNIENYAVEDYEVKKEFQEKIKEYISTYGIIGLGVEYLSALLSMILKTPEVLQKSTTTILAFIPFALAICLINEGTLKKIKDKKELIKKLKEKGIYDQIIEYSNLNAEIKEIEKEGRVR